MPVCLSFLPPQNRPFLAWNITIDQACEERRRQERRVPSVLLLLPGLPLARTQGVPERLALMTCSPKSMPLPVPT